MQRSERASIFRYMYTSCLVQRTAEFQLTSA